MQKFDLDGELASEIGRVTAWRESGSGGIVEGDLLVPSSPRKFPAQDLSDLCMNLVASHEARPDRTLKFPDTDALVAHIGDRRAA